MENFISNESNLIKPELTASDFMEFFNDDEKLNQISEADRIDIFLNVLTGSSDITVKLLNQLLRNYDVCDIEISKINY